MILARNRQQQLSGNKDFRLTILEFRFQIFDIRF